MPVHVDMAEMEAALARCREELGRIASGEGSAACQARMGIAVEQAFARQFAEEVNRDTNGEYLSDAVASCCANITMSLIDSMLPDEATPLDKVAFINEQLSKQVRFIGHYLRGEAKGPSFEVRTQEGGRA